MLRLRWWREVHHNYLFLAVADLESYQNVNGVEPRRTLVERLFDKRYLVSGHWPPIFTKQTGFSEAHLFTFCAQRLMGKVM